MRLSVGLHAVIKNIDINCLIDVFAKKRERQLEASERAPINQRLKGILTFLCQSLMKYETSTFAVFELTPLMFMRIR